MKVIFYDPYLSNGTELAVGFERVRSLDEVMPRADILSVHTPLNEETRGMVGAASLAMAKPELIVINTARGPIVDLDALTEALQAGRIAGAGLDVLPKEPADSDHPLIKAFLARASHGPKAGWCSARIRPSTALALEDMQRKAIEVIVTYLRRRHADELRQPTLPRRRQAAAGRRRRGRPTHHGCGADPGQRPITAPGSMGGPET